MTSVGGNEENICEKIFTRQASVLNFTRQVSLPTYGTQTSPLFLGCRRKPGLSQSRPLPAGQPPSLCAQIIDLETEIGTRLFERTHQPVSLTAAGHSFVSGARKTLNHNGSSVVQRGSAG